MKQPTKKQDGYCCLNSDAVASCPVQSGDGSWPVIWACRGEKFVYGGRGRRMVGVKQAEDAQSGDKNTASPFNSVTD